MSQYNSTDIHDISPYGYSPTRGVSFLFLVLFGISTATHLVQALYYRLWFLLPTVILCGLGELAGWSGRLWSSYNITNQNAYTIQITCTIISPTPLLAASFVILRRIILRLGQGYSRLSYRRYTRIFLTCDILALFTQAVGGGIASGSNDPDIPNPNIGIYIMLGGIGFQLLCIVIYAALAAEFLGRYVKDRPFRRIIIHAHRSRTPRRMKIMILGMGIMAVFLFIRTVYRTAELADGFDGVILNTEWPFDLFDALMVAAAMISLNVIHPGRFLVPLEIPQEVANDTDPKSSSVSTEAMLEYRRTAVTA